MPEGSNNNFVRRPGTLGDRAIGITTYKVGARYACRIDNVDPGAVIARGSGATPEEAELLALESAALSFKLQDANEAMRRTVAQLRPRRSTPKRS